MRTIQEILKELDTKRLTNVYIQNYWNKPERWPEDMTIKEIRKRQKKILRKYIKRLRTVEVKQKEPAVLFVSRRIEETYSDVGFALSYVKDILEDTEDCPTYAYEWAKHEEIMGFFVAETELTSYYIYELAADVMHNASFFGFKQEILPKAKKRLNKAKHNIENGKCYTHEEIVARLKEKYNIQLPPEEEVELKELEHKVYLAKGEHYRKAKTIELEKIKAILDLSSVSSLDSTAQILESGEKETARKMRSGGAKITAKKTATKVQDNEITKADEKGEV